MKASALFLKFFIKIALTKYKIPSRLFNSIRISRLFEDFNWIDLTLTITHIVRIKAKLDNNP
jgi:hypothetical protein